MSRKGETVYYWRECHSDTRKIHVKKVSGTNHGKRALPSKELQERLSNPEEKISLEELNSLCFLSENEVAAFFNLIKGRVLSPKFGAKKSVESPGDRMTSSKTNPQSTANEKNNNSIKDLPEELPKSRDDDEVIGGTLETWEKSRNGSGEIDFHESEVKDPPTEISGLILKKAGSEYQLVKVNSAPAGYRFLRDDDFPAAEQGKFNTKRLLTKIFRSQDEFLKIRAAIKKGKNHTQKPTGSEK